MSEFNVELAEEITKKLSNQPHLHIQSMGAQCVLGWAGRDRWNNTMEDRFIAGKRALGLNAFQAYLIWGTHSERKALYRLNKITERAKACQERRATREERRALKRMARDEDAYQKKLDKVARRQAREAINAVYDKVDAERAERRTCVRS